MYSNAFCVIDDGLCKHNGQSASRDRQRRLCETVRRVWTHSGTVTGMSERNGDRARFQKNRRRKLRHRERVHARAVTVCKHKDDLSRRATSRAASLNMLDEGGPLRRGD